MIKLIMGLKGTGKTKTLIQMVNNVVEKEHGNVVCIEKGFKLRYDIGYNCRLISADEFKIDSYDKCYGFICGLRAGNYDITDIFIDSIMKFCGEDQHQLANFLKMIEPLSEHVNFLITASYDVNNAIDELKKYF